MKEFKEFSQLTEAKGSIFDTKPKSTKDALDPEILIQGFGRMKYTQLKKMIANGFDDMAKLPQLVALVLETDVDVSETPPPPPPLDPAILTSRVFVAAK